MKLKTAMLKPQKVFVLTTMQGFTVECHFWEFDGVAGELGTFSSFEVRDGEVFRTNVISKVFRVSRVVE